MNPAKTVALAFTLLSAPTACAPFGIASDEIIIGTGPAIDDDAGTAAVPSKTDAADVADPFDDAATESSAPSSLGCTLDRLDGGTLRDVSRQKFATADVNAADASKANDGFPSSGWSPTDLEPGHWWQVDLGEVRLLRRLITNWPDSVRFQYRVDTSPDSARWITAIDRMQDERTTSEREDIFPDDNRSCARFVRITITSVTTVTPVLYSVSMQGI